MIKYLEVADFHYNPSRKEECVSAFNNIIKASADVDFLVFAGDLFDLPIYANDDLNTLIDLFKEIKKPCCGVCGTQGHEIRSMYRALIESVGFVLLEPAKEYGFINGAIIPTDNKLTPDILIYGLDEINKKTVLAKHPELSPSDVNNFCTESLKKIITEKIASERSRLPYVPSVLVIHGNISDAVDRLADNNEALKRSDIIIKTEWIKEAEINRTSAGHIHQYIEFEKINGGYGGSPAWNWNSTGFLPCFNLVTFEDIKNIKIDRIPYGTPERKKIYKPLDKYDSNIAYWLEYEGDLKLNPALNGAHEWSRMTLPEAEKKERRVEIKDVENKPLPEIARIFDKNITESQIKCLEEAEKSKTTGDKLSRYIRVEEVTVEGSVLFHGAKMHIDLNNISGLTQVTGENGSGKSSVLAFCTPYPCLVGKDTESGRTSAIKDFFDGEGKIFKKITKNGERHELLINISKNKVECSVTVEGKPALEKTNFDACLEWCEAQYGSLDNYITTSFYVQPLQGKTESGLMTASQTTIRDIVQDIAGINREEEREYCLNKAKILSNSLKEKEIKINVLMNGAENIPGLTKLEAEYKLNYEDAKNRNNAIKEKLKKASEALAVKKSEQAEQEKKVEEKKALQIKICNKHQEKKTLEEGTRELPSLTARLNLILAEEEKYKKYQSDLLIYTEAEKEKSKIMAEVEKLKAAYNHNLELKASYEREISVYNKPCPNCGYICEDNKAKIDELNAKINALDLAEPDLTGLRAEYKKYLNISKPSYINAPEDKAPIEAKINELKNAGEKISAIEAELKILSDMEGAISVNVIDTSADEAEVSKINIDAIFAENEEKDSYKLWADTNANLTQAKNNLSEAEKIKAETEADSARLKDWEYCADILAPSKIPAMELEAVLNIIDTKATEYLKPYRNSRYIVMTETQKEGKKSVVDKFDIKILDTQTGEIKSFKNFSVGEKSFILAAYNNSLLDIRKNNANINFYPIISDEQDAFIDKDNRAAFYSMQGEKDMLVVSHSPDIDNFIFNKININNLLTK